MTIEENILLAPFTTFRIGGRARFFVRVQTLEELIEISAFAKKNNLPIFTLGGGSNLLVPDEGFDGIVIQIALKGIELREQNRETILVAGGGEVWDEVVQRSVVENLWGLENLSGIPGSVGGAVVQNIGAYNQALSQTFLWTEVFDIETKEVRRLFRHDCNFDYRDSVFKKQPHLIVLRVAFILPHAGVPDLSYKDLASVFESKREAPLADIRSTILTIRKGKFPDLLEEGTAGSFFKNPVLSREMAAPLMKLHPDMPLFSIPESSGIKIPLAYLLDKGLSLRGFALGRARLYERQPLVIAAQFGATAKEVHALAQEVQKKIFEKYSIEIEPEVKILL